MASGRKSGRVNISTKLERGDVGVKTYNPFPHKKKIELLKAVDLKKARGTWLADKSGTNQCTEIKEKNERNERQGDR